MSGAWRRITQVPIQYPFAFGICISTFKTSFSDLLVQKVVEKRETVDWRRNAAFASFGFFYLGGIQYALYVPIFGRMFPNAAGFAAKSIREKLKDGKGLFTLGAQVFIDQCVHHPILYFPVFYTIKEFVMKPEPSITNALTTYRNNFSEDIPALWKIWIPATIFNFAFMPMWGRIPTVAATSMVWSCVLSAMRGGDIAHAEELAGGEFTGGNFTLVREGLSDFFSSPVDVDKTQSHVYISAAGPDRVGWVSKVAEKVADWDGNITHSKMVRLGHDFIIMMHVAVPPEKRAGMVKALRKDPELKPLNIRASSLSRRETGRHKAANMGVRIHCVGEDKPGMLAAISKKISEENLSVDNITTDLRMNNGKREFVINWDCSASHALNKDEVNALFNDFSDLKTEVGFDVVDVRVHLEKDEEL